MARWADRKRLRRCRWVLPPTYNSDHPALVVRMAAEGGNQGVQGGRKQAPFGKKRKEELTDGDKMFELVEKVEKPRRRERAENK